MWESFEADSGAFWREMYQVVETLDGIVAGSGTDG